ncbi:RND transporter [Chitiniphilus shinanonensis]|uniref:RND transporter n=1 Tax=Chitiniphilus shinanonensis TaxID=553088 RepID=A0ABQ6C120_9NEIS|nr:TolC family protein [Chitiniphilus shinanonensis]GLS05883.1 RND transporter [Chitiniphilus shinanonensis]
MQQPRFRRVTLAALVSAALLAGCAVSPTPIPLEERQADLARQRSDMFADQEPIQGEVTLEDAMARALKYNLDHRLKLMEEALAQRQLDLARWDMLPKLTADAGYFWRNNELASSSKDYVTGEQSLVPSTSSDRIHDTADLTLSWNVLDFGVSYYTAQQQADRVLVMGERRRKVVHLMMQQVRQAYWQALGAQQLDNKVEPILKLAQQALDDSRKIEKEKLQPPLDTLNYQRQLLDILRQLESVRDELAQAKPRLASIMNVAPGTPLQLSVPSDFATPVLPVQPEQMEETALLHRPELVEAGYNERIGLLETKKAMAKLLPGLNIEFGSNYDSDSYLVNQSWRDLGLRVSWNLMNLLNYKNIRGTAQAQYEVARQQHLALNMAVLTQVHVAYRDYQGRKRQFELSDEMNDVDQRILTHTRNAARADAQGKLSEIRAQASAVMSELRLYQSFGAMQNAYGQMLATLGVDPLPEEVRAHDLATLRSAIAQREREPVVQAKPQ